MECGAVSNRADVDRRVRIFVHEQGCMEIIRRRSIIIIIISLQHRTSQRKAIIKGEGELDV